MWCLTFVSKLWGHEWRPVHGALAASNVVRCWDGRNVSKVSQSPANAHWPRLYNVMEYHTCCWTFSTSWVLYASILGFHITVHHPYISTCFCETPFIPFASVLLWSTSWYKTNRHHPYIDSTVLSMHLSHRILKYVRIFETFADEKLMNIFIASMHNVFVWWQSSKHRQKLFDTHFWSSRPAILWFQCEKTFIKFYS